MALRLGDVAPNFKAQTTEGEIEFYEYLGNGWGILFSYPVDWNHGEDVIVALSVSTEDAQKKFQKGVKIVKPYLRFTPQPNV